MDQFGIGISDDKSAVSEQQVAAYMARVMGWMALGLLTTFVASLLCLTSADFISFLYQYPMMYYGILIAELAIVLGMSAAVNKINSSIAIVMFMAYSALTGVTMTVLVMLFEIMSVFTVFIMAAALFLTMAVFGAVTRRDLTQLGSMATFGLIGIIIASLVNMFLGSGVLDYVISFIGIIVFIALTAYDTKKIKGIYITAMDSGYSDEGEPVRKASIYGALTLYLDFINLFIMLLRIFGKRR